MSWPGTIILDVVFIPVFGLLGLLSLFNAIRSRNGYRFGFIFLILFCAIRLVANILLLVGFLTEYNNLSIPITGYILQGFGYSFLLTSSVGFFNSFVQNEGTPQISDRGRVAIRVTLTLVNVAALLLVIIGFEANTDVLETVAQNPQSNVHINVLVQAGYIIYLCLTVVLLGLVATYWIRTSHARVSSLSILFALTFMLVRSAYYVYLAYSEHPYNGTLAEKVVLQYLMEVLAVIAFSLIHI